jgi:FkbM family methyltransferase
MGVAGPFIADLKKKFNDTDPLVILDVGSRDLIESIELSNAFPNAKIIAFEPNPTQFKICSDASKPYPNIDVYEYALSDEEGITDFWIVNENVGASSILQPAEKFLDTGWLGHKPCTYYKISGIRMRRLDSVLKELNISKVDVVWMDIQGNELRALKGMGDFLKDVKMMQVEAAVIPYYKGHAPKDELEKWLHEQGFDTHFIVLNNGNPFIESDLVCTRVGF